MKKKMNQRQQRNRKQRQTKRTRKEKGQKEEKHQRIEKNRISGHVGERWVRRRTRQLVSKMLHATDNSTEAKKSGHS